MINDPGTLVVVGGIIGIVLTSITGIMVAKTNANATKESATIPPYDKLADRLSKLEEKDEEKDEIIERLKDRMIILINDRDSLVAYLRQLWTWASSGAPPPPPPVPAHLRDIFDPDEWDVARITQRTTTTTRTYVRPPGSDESHEVNDIEKGTE